MFKKRMHKWRRLELHKRKTPPTAPKKYKIKEPSKWRDQDFTAAEAVFRKGAPKRAMFYNRIRVSCR